MLLGFNCIRFLIHHNVKTEKKEKTLRKIAILIDSQILAFGIDDILELSLESLKSCFGHISQVIMFQEKPSKFKSVFLAFFQTFIDLCTLSEKKRPHHSLSENFMDPSLTDSALLQMQVPAAVAASFSVPFSVPIPVLVPVSSPVPVSEPDPAPDPDSDPCLDSAPDSVPVPVPVKFVRSVPLATRSGRAINSGRSDLAASSAAPAASSRRRKHPLPDQPKYIGLHPALQVESSRLLDEYRWYQASRTTAIAASPAAFERESLTARAARQELLQQLKTDQADVNRWLSEQAVKRERSLLEFKKMREYVERERK